LAVSSRCTRVRTGKGWRLPNVGPGDPRCPVGTALHALGGEIDGYQAALLPRQCPPRAGDCRPHAALGAAQGIREESIEPWQDIQFCDGHRQRLQSPDLCTGYFGNPVNVNERSPLIPPSPWAVGCQRTAGKSMPSHGTAEARGGESIRARWDQPRHCWSGNESVLPGWYGHVVRAKPVRRHRRRAVSLIRDGLGSRQNDLQIATAISSSTVLVRQIHTGESCRRPPRIPSEGHSHADSPIRRLAFFLAQVAESSWIWTSAGTSRGLRIGTVGLCWLSTSNPE
jgi:hypothetical protein